MIGTIFNFCEEPIALAAVIESTFANYAHKLVGIGNKNEFPIAAKEKQNNIFNDDLIKTSETQSEETDVCSISFNLFSQKIWVDEMNQPKWRMKRNDTGRLQNQTSWPRAKYSGGHLFLGFSGMLLTMVFRSVEVLSHKLKLPCPKGRSCLWDLQCFAQLEYMPFSVFTDRYLN